MAVQLNPYLHFRGNAREAMEFYRAVLGGDLQIMTFGDVGGGGSDFPADGVMHAYLGTDAGLALMASDGADESSLVEGRVSCSISGDDGELLRGYFDGLAEGGRIDVAFETQMWGDTFGQVTDRFGVRWLINATAPRS